MNLCAMHLDALMSEAHMLDTASRQHDSKHELFWLLIGCCYGQVLMTKAKVEAEDAQRILLGALNGIAALLSADGKQAEAISAYRQARMQCSHSIATMVHGQHCHWSYMLLACSHESCKRLASGALRTGSEAYCR